MQFFFYYQLTILLVLCYDVQYGISSVNNFDCASDVSRKSSQLDQNNRKKRSVIFPSGSIFQISLGIAIASDVQPNTGQVNFGFQQNIKLPTNITELRYPPQARSIQAFSIYEYLQNIFNRYGLNGTECLKKVICQIAETPLNEGILEEIITYILTPSYHIETLQSPVYEDPYAFSEKIGKSQGNCSYVFLDCPKTPLDLISNVFIDM